MTSAPAESRTIAVPGRATRHDPARVLAGLRIVFDCRWLGLGGAGRVTELLLRCFQTEPPAGRWILWGARERVEPLAFAGAELAPWSGDPRALAGQRDLGRVPAGDIVLYGHQIRPLRPGRSVTLIHDTIPLRYGGNAGTRALKRVFFRAAARLSDHVLTDSAFALECVSRDLDVSPDRVSVLMFPLDFERATAIARLRERLGQEDRLLYLGRFAPHKNLHRLFDAFANSRFAEEGGRLLLAGGWGDEVDATRKHVSRLGLARVEVRGYCSEDEVDRFLATSRALILPSLEEGFGLPAYEAAASGLPVAASRTGALTDLPPERVALFDPRDRDAMTQAIDDATSRGPLEPLPFDAPLANVVLSALAQAISRNDRPTQ
jgi:glycosyltransferase involved in cell wall biosynthesis